MGQEAVRFAKSSAGKKAALAASGFLAPIAIGIALMLFAFHAGLQTQQVAQVLTGVRFSRLYGQMTKRLSHIKETRVLWDIDPENRNDALEELNKRRGVRRSLVGVLTGTSDRKIYRDLRSRGYSFEFEDRLVPGRSRAVALVDKNGNKVIDFSKDGPGKSIQQLKDFEAKLRAQPGYGSGLWGKFKARRTTRLIAYQAGIRFFRFRKAMDGIRQARDWARNRTRGPPPVDLKSASHAVSDDIITQKARVKRWGRLGGGLRLGILLNIGNPEIDEAARGWARETQKGWAERTRNWVDKKSNKLSKTKLVSKWEKKGTITRLGGFARGASIGLFLATAFCTVKVLVDMVRDLAGTKINQQMDTAGSLFTVASQMRVGDMEHAISNNLDGRLEGFAGTATYQILHEGNNRPTKEHVSATIEYVNRHFNIKKSFGSMFGAMDSFIRVVTNIIKVGISSIPGKDLADWGVRFLNFGLSLIPGVDDPIPSVDEVFSWLVNSGCPLLLNAVTQIVLGVILGAIEVGLAIVTGGGWAAVSVIVNSVVRAIIFGITVSATAQALDLEGVVLQHMMPEAVAIMSGVDSALAENQKDPADFLSSEPGSGPENYLKLDYGAWHLSQAQALAEGGGLVEKGTAVAQDRVYIAQYKNSYTRQGIWDNIANPHNPYSMIAKLRSRLPASPLEAQPSQIRSTASWLATKTPVGLVDPVLADEELDEVIGYLLYPDQGRTITEDGEVIDSDSENDPVVGFREAEVNGEGEFNFVTNSFYVEDNFDDFRSRYGKCLVVSLPELRLHQAGIKKSDNSPFYPEECTEPDARRYSVYYQDCLHLSDMELLDTNSSPMLASECDYLLPDSWVERLKEADDELESLSNISASRDINWVATKNVPIYDQTPINNPASQPLTMASAPQIPVGARLWPIA